jgi:hypothetical protein
LACKRSEESQATPKIKRATLKPAGNEAPRPEDLPAGGPDDEIKPVYPSPTGPASPIADKLCAALYDLPRRRMAECCKTAPLPPIVTAECVRNLTSALELKSAAIATEVADRCVAALEKAHQGCDWVGPVPVALPAECRRMVEGAVVENGSCRSSLECKGSLHCAGVGPTESGRCSPARKTGEVCRTAVDPLAAFLRDDDAEVRHAECEGFCKRHRCVPRASAGQACLSNVECGPDDHCDGQTCVAGSKAKVGTPCAETGCEPGARCIDHLCQKPLPAGDKCTNPFSCAGACVAATSSSGARPKSGICGMGCDLKRLLTVEAAWPPPPSH